MGVDKSHLLNLLEMRFDYQSARNILVNWRKSSSRKEELSDLNDEDLKSLLTYLRDNAPEATRVHTAIERLILAHDAPRDIALDTPPAPSFVDGQDHTPPATPQQDAALSQIDTIDELSSPSSDDVASSPDDASSSDDGSMSHDDASQNDEGDASDSADASESSQENASQTNEPQHANNIGGKKKKKKH